MCDYYVETMCAGRFGLGWAHDVFTFACHMFIHFSCIHTNFVSIIFILNYIGSFLCVSLSLSLSFSLSWLVALWHLNRNLLRPGTLFVLGHLFLLPMLILLHPMPGFVMIKPVRTFRRTFHKAAFIRNAKLFYRTFSILTFRLSSSVGVRSNCVASRSLVLPWSYKSFTPTCTDSTIMYLSLSLAFKVHAL